MRLNALFANLVAEMNYAAKPQRLLSKLCALVTLLCISVFGFKPAAIQVWRRSIPNNE
jgi:hypothetical protein